MPNFTYLQRYRWAGASALNELFTGAVEATEEAVYNALVAAVPTRGVDGHVLHAIPHDRLRASLTNHHQ